MNGRAEVERRKQKLDATLSRAATLPTDPEILSDFARYFCVLVAGFLEQAVIELVLEHSRTHSAPSVQRHVEQNLRRFTNAKAQKIIQLLGSFDPDWRKDMESYLVDEYKAAVDSIVHLRNRVSHGADAGVTIALVKDYYDRVKRAVDHIADLCVPL